MYLFHYFITQFFKKFSFQCVKNFFYYYIYLVFSHAFQVPFFSPCSFYLFFICFTEWRYVNLACFIILLWSDGNISSPLRYSYLSILSASNADIFATSLLIVLWWWWWILLWYGLPTKGVQPYFQTRPLSEILTIANLWHAASMTSTSAEPELNEVVQ